MIVTTAQLFKHAYGKYAVGAYNINNAEQAMGLFKGCISSKAPFIIQISKGARKYTDKRMLEAIIRSASEIFPEAIFAVHLDHGDEETCYDCIKSGFFSSVMIDASHDPFAENVAITKRVVTAAHAKGISVEAELGMLGGVEEDIKVEEGNACLTDPAEAEDFVKQTGCDSLACAIGTSHGAFKFKGKQSLHFDVLDKIKARLPGFPLVMHGSSSVPKEEVDRINAAGGTIAGSMGVDVNEYLPRPSAASPRSTSTPTAASSGRGCTASSSATIPRSSTSARRARSSSRNTRSSSRAATCCSAPPASWTTSGSPSASKPRPAMRHRLQFLAVLLIGLALGFFPARMRAEDATLGPGSKLDSLTVGTITYSQVTVRSLNARTLMITHAGGMASIHLRDLSPEWQTRFRYNAAAEMAADEAAKNAPPPPAAPVVRKAKPAAAKGQSKMDALLLKFGQPAAVQAEVDLRPRFFELELGVKNQGYRPSCAVFAIVSALEFQNAELSGRVEKFSEEYLIWAVRKSVRRMPAPGSNSASDDPNVKDYQDEASPFRRWSPPSAPTASPCRRACPIPSAPGSTPSRIRPPTSCRRPAATSGFSSSNCRDGTGRPCSTTWSRRSMPACPSPSA